MLEPVTVELVSMGCHGMVQTVDDIIVGCSAGNEWSYGMDVIDAVIWWSDRDG